MKIYVASSWRNGFQEQVIIELLKAGYEVYDFKNPGPDNTAFQWSEIDPYWKEWSTSQFVEALNHPIAKKSFQSDMNALKECDLCVLVLPCGRSAHLEAGYAAGAGKGVIIYIPIREEPELMYKMTAGVHLSLPSLLKSVSFYDITHR